MKRSLLLLTALLATTFSVVRAQSVPVAPLVTGPTDGVGKILFIQSYSNGYPVLAPSGLAVVSGSLQFNGTPLSGGGVTWPATGSLVVSNGTASPAGLAEVDGNCVKGVSGAWSTGTCGGGSQTYPSAGIMISTGSAFGTSLAAPTGTVVGTSDTQTLTNKTLDGVTPTTMAFLDATSSVQTQLNAKAPLASPALTGVPTAPTATTGTNTTQVATTAFVLANAGSGISGLTANCLPKAASATTITGCSSLSDDGTTLTGTEGLAIPSVTLNGASNGYYNYTYTGTGATAPGTNTFQISPSTAVTTPWALNPGSAPATGLVYWTNASNILSWSTATGSQVGTALAGAVISPASLSTQSLALTPSTGPSSNTTLNGTCTSGATSCTVVSTTGYPTSGILLIGAGSGTAFYASYTGTTGTTFTGLSRGLYGSTDATIATGNQVNLISLLIADNTSTIPSLVKWWKGGVSLGQSTGDLGNLNIPGNGNAQGGALFANPLYLAGQANPPSIKTTGTNGGILVSNAINQFATDQYGITSVSNGSLAMTTGTATLAPVTGVVVITGTPATSGTFLTMTVPSSSSCLQTSMSCTITLINTTSGTITTGSGTSAGNFATPFTLAAKASMQCTAFGTTALWYCN